MRESVYHDHGLAVGTWATVCRLSFLRRGRLSNLFLPKLRHFFFILLKSWGAHCLHHQYLGICPQVQVQLAYHSGAPSDKEPTKLFRMGNARRGGGQVGVRVNPELNTLLGLEAGGAAVWYVCTTN
jgi:hypothetical protein